MKDVIDFLNTISIGFFETFFLIIASPIKLDGDNLRVNPFVYSLLMAVIAQYLFVLVRDRNKLITADILSLSLIGTFFIWFIASSVYGALMKLFNLSPNFIKCFKLCFYIFPTSMIIGVIFSILISYVFGVKDYIISRGVGSEPWFNPIAYIASTFIMNLYFLISINFENGTIRILIISFITVTVISILTFVHSFIIFLWDSDTWGIGGGA